jgi:hypothetical protein
MEYARFNLLKGSEMRSWQFQTLLMAWSMIYDRKAPQEWVELHDVAAGLGQTSITVRKKTKALCRMGMLVQLAADGPLSDCFALTLAGDQLCSAYVDTVGRVITKIRPIAQWHRVKVIRDHMRQMWNEVNEDRRKAFAEDFARWMFKHNKTLRERSIYEQGVGYALSRDFPSPFLTVRLDRPVKRSRYRPPSKS